LEILDHDEARLPKMQKIHLKIMEFEFLSARRFHLAVNYSFRATITSLRISDLGTNRALREDGGLYNYVSSFPNLKYLKILYEVGTKRPQTINLEKLVEIARNLETLNIHSVSGMIRIATPKSATLIPYIIIDPPLKMCLKVYKMDVNTLEYIMDKLKNNLEALHITMSIQCDSTDNNDMDKAIFDKFAAFCDTLKSSAVSVYRGDNGTSAYHSDRQTVIAYDADSDNPASEEEKDSAKDSDDVYSRYQLTCGHMRRPGYLDWHSVTDVHDSCSSSSANEEDSDY
jgi:hypothetical protein